VKFHFLALVLSIAAVSGVLAAFLSSFPRQVIAQVQCPSGTVVITSATRVIASAAGLPSSVQCWNPNDLNTGIAVGNAKQYLQQHATAGANISCLNSQFAEQIQKLIEAAPSNLGAVVIDSGYRAPSTQISLVASGASRAGPCQSYHNYGLAVDFNNSSKSVVQWIRANVSRFGLATIGNPVSGCFASGFCDPAHIQEAGPLPPISQCGICSSSGSGTNSTAALGASTTGAPIASQSLGRSVQISVPTMTPAVPLQTPPSCAAQYICSESALLYEASDCVTQVVQMCNYGCFGSTCNQANPGAAQPTSQLITSPGTPNASAALPTVSPIASNPALLIARNGLSGPLIASSHVDAPSSTSLITIIPGGTSTVGYAPSPHIGAFSTSSFSSGSVDHTSFVQTILRGLAVRLAALLYLLSQLGKTA
jgi:hypothetical protein